MLADTLTGGFTDPAIQSAYAFRSIMDAMARPGTIQDLASITPPAPLSQAAATVLLTLCDIETPAHLAGDTNCETVRAWLAFHTGTPLSGPATCLFAVGRWSDLTPLSAYPIGTSDYPDRSATLVVECPDLAASGARLEGPGIKDSASLSVPDIAAFKANHALYPLGLDIFLTCGSRLAALPRSTRVR